MIERRSVHAMTSKQSSLAGSWFSRNAALEVDLLTPAMRDDPYPTYARLRRELRAGRFDVIHVHEPVAPVVGYDVLDTQLAPLVGTFHCYSENAFSNNLANFFGARRRLNRLHVRIAVSEAAAWTGRPGPRHAGAIQ